MSKKINTKSITSLENINKEDINEEFIGDLFFSSFKKEKYELCIEIYNKFIKVIKKDFYKFVYTYILCLIKVNEKEKAIEKLKEELSMPYIPLEYENKFVSLYNELTFKESEARNEFILNEEQIIDILINSKEDDMISLMIMQLANMNIRKFLPFINDFLKSENKNIYKLMLLDILKSQAINQDFEFINNKKTYNVNPSKYVDIFERDDYLYIDNLLKSKLETKYPDLYNSCKEVLFLYLCYIWPNVVIDKDKIALAINYYVNSLYATESDIEELELTYDVKIDNLEDILSILSYACSI